MYNNSYLNNINNQANIDRINNQIAELQRIKDQMQQPQVPTNLTQNFQLAPQSRDTMKYATSMEDVQKEIVVGDTAYFSRDMSVVWIKNAKGDIKTYELNEIIPRDEKDIKIEYLQTEIEQLKKGMKNNGSITNVDEQITESNQDEKSSSISKTTRSNKKSK